MLAYNRGALSLLPAEIWEMILEKMDSSVDRWNLLKAYPEVAEALDYETPKELFDEVLPSLFKYLSVSDVRNVRKVCKRWDKKVHESIEKHPSFQPYNADTSNGLPINTLETNIKCPIFHLATTVPVLSFRTVNSITDFIQMKSEDTKFHRGPIFGGTIHLDPRIPRSLTDDNPILEYHTACLKLLDNYGNHVSHLKLSTHSKIETSGAFYLRLRDILRCTPNLLSLSVNARDQDHVVSLDKKLQVRPLPQLTRLKCIFYEQDDSNPRNMLEALLTFASREGSNVRKVKITSLPSPYWGNFQKCFSNIFELELMNSNYSTSSLKFLHESKIQKLTEMSSELFVAKQFHEIKLDNLRIFKAGYVRVEEEWKVQFSNLVRLSIEDSYHVSYDFLCSIPSLAHLDILTTLSRSQELRARAAFDSSAKISVVTKEVLKWVYHGPVCNSEIWNWFQNLQVLGVGRKSNLEMYNVTWTRFSRN